MTEVHTYDSLAFKVNYSLEKVFLEKQIVLQLMTKSCGYQNPKFFTVCNTVFTGSYPRTDKFNPRTLIFLIEECFNIILSHTPRLTKLVSS
jgi:hypothetical protein